MEEISKDFIKNDFSFCRGRDPARIEGFLKRLGKCWEKVPDWRFGQLMMNVLGEMQAHGRDPFFPEEQEMIEFFEKFFGISEAVNEDDGQ